MDHPSVSDPGSQAVSDTSTREVYTAAIRASRSVVELLKREDGLPGLQVAVARGGEIVWSEGFGHADLETSQPVTSLTRFRIGSLSKPLTAAAALRLHEKERLDLDAPVRRYVPSFPEKSRPVTARHLLGHLSGIRHYRDDESQIRYEHYDDVLDALELFAGDSLLHPPGTDYEYSSYGYNLLSAVVQEAGGSDFLSYMRDEVFRPLGMRHTTAEHMDSILANRAEFYGWGETGGLVNAPFTDNSYKWASGGFLSTAEDLVRFGSGLLAGDLIRPSLVDTMFTSLVTAGGDTTGYAMGWRPRQDWAGRPVVRHGGSSVGGRAFLMLWPEEKLVVALLANASRSPLFAEEAQTIAHFFLDHPPDTDRIGGDGEEIVGTYRFTTPRGDEEVGGRLRLTGSGRHPGWMEWEGAAAPVPVAVVDRHGMETRLIGAGTHGVLNLWAEFDDDGFSGRWDWLGRTSEIDGEAVELR